MGLADAFGSEDRVPVLFSTFYQMMKAAAEAEAKMKYLENAVAANVPNHCIQSMLDGKPHPVENAQSRACTYGAGVEDPDA